MIPSLYPSIDGPHVPDSIAAEIYDKAIYPAALQSMDDPEQAHGHYQHWPITWSFAKTSVGTAHGIDGHCLRQIRAQDVALFGPTFLELLEQDPKFHGAFLYHEIMGTKLATWHHVDASDQELRDKLDELLDIFDPEALPRNPQADGSGWEGEVWHVDVALEFAVPGSVVHFRREAHDLVLQLAYPLSDPAKIRNFVRQSEIVRADTRRAYRIDYAASLSQVAGFFFDAKKTSCIDAREPAISVICYSTEKNLWFHRGEKDGVYTPPQPSDVLQANTFDKILERLQQVITNLLAAGGIIGDEDIPVQQGSGRLEVRVPVRDACRVLCSVPRRFAQDALLIWDPDVWW